MAGDFNTSERSPLYARISDRGLVEGFREAESGPDITFPRDRDLFGVPAFWPLRID